MGQFLKLDDNFAVAPQLSADDLKVAADAGIRTIVCNRPDGEDPTQPESAQMARTAAGLGLSFHDVPFNMHTLDKGVIDNLEIALGAVEGPVLAYCRSGTRSSIAWCVLQRRAGKTLEEVLDSARAAGYELSSQAPLIEALV